MGEKELDEKRKELDTMSVGKNPCLILTLYTGFGLKFYLAIKI